MNSEMEPFVEKDTDPLMHKPYRFPGTLSFCEQYCCCFRLSQYKLTEDEAYAYNLLVKQAISYNDQDLRHELLLKELWEKLYPDTPIPTDLKDEKWKNIGFQSNDARRDFRGGGVLALQALRYIVDNEEGLTRLLSIPKYYYFLVAIVVINMAYNMMNYLYLIEGQTLIPNRKANIYEFKEIIRELSEDSVILREFRYMKSLCEDYKGELMPDTIKSLIGTSHTWMIGIMRDGSKLRHELSLLRSPERVINMK